jgi:hypothetical protein
MLIKNILEQQQLKHDVKHQYSMVNREETYMRIIKLAARAYASWNKFIESLFPQPPNPLEQKIYTLNSTKEPDLATMIQELKNTGHQDLVEKILSRPPKVLVGFLYDLSEPGELIYDTYGYTFQKVQDCPNITVEDFSTDALTVNDIIAREKPDKIIIVTAKRRQRPPGIYTAQTTLQATQENPAEMLRASLEGSLDIDALLDALRVLAPGRIISIVEYEPPEDATQSLKEQLIQVIDKILQEECQK